MRNFKIRLVLAALALLAAAANSSLSASEPGASATLEEVALLRQELAAQQRQLEELRSALNEQTRLLGTLLRNSAAGGAKQAPAAGAETFAPPQQAAPKQLAAGEQKPAAAPLSLRIGNADFTPGGYLEFTSIFRSTNVGSGVGTNFGGIPFNDTGPGKLTESRFSAQKSRVSLTVTANPGKQQVTGYVEADFLGFLPTNAHVSSNSNSLRMRLGWVQVRRGKWEVLGGQSWSLLTPNRTGISPAPSDLFYSQGMDPNYQVGLAWSRGPQFRLVFHGDRHWTAGFALENPEQYTGGGVVLPSFATNQVDTGVSTATPTSIPT